MKTKRDEKVVFLDRDGVINKNPPEHDYVKKWSEFTFLPGAKEAIAYLKKAGYKVILVSNQRGIARGLMSQEDIADIHKNMQKELATYGGKIDAIYVCPHNYNDNCDCRKPKPGLLYRAARVHHIDLTKATLIGDSQSDIEAGKTAGCRTILMQTDGNLLKIVEDLLAKPK